MSQEQPLQIFAEDEYFDPLIESLKQELYYTADMTCAIGDCTFKGTFPTKTRYVRHWEEKHTLDVTKWSCAYAHCSALLRRRSDMKIHIKQVHAERDNVRIEQIMAKCTKEVVRNKGFIDPGFFTFKGRTKPSIASSPPSPKIRSVISVINSDCTQASSSQLISLSQSETTSLIQSETTVMYSTPVSSSAPVASSTPVSSSTPVLSSAPVTSSTPVSSSTLDPASVSVFTSTPEDIPTITSATSLPTAIQPDMLTVTSALSVEKPSEGDEIDFRVHIPLSLSEALQKPTELKMPSLPVLPLFRKTAVMETQTSYMDVKEVYLPPIPDNVKEIEEHLVYLCNHIDSFMRQREAAKQRLEELRIAPSIDKEKQLRRKLESENRELKRQLAEIKYRDTLFGNRMMDEQ